MVVIDDAEAMRAWTRTERSGGHRIALVPTMGALHVGHLALVARAAELADRVIVSIFVNPTQFGPDEDFERYPRALDSDVGVLREQGLSHAVFAPPVEVVYPGGETGQRVWIDIDGLDRTLCGRFRPGHFRGVATIVAKLFHLCRPDTAVFGKKDAQQLVIVRRLEHDLAMGIDVVGVDTVREEDGLALSSRNRYLSLSERPQAVVLSRAVKGAAAAVEAGERETKVIAGHMRRELETAELARVQYAEVVDAADLSPIEKIQPGQEVLAAVSVFFGDTRLIDNTFVRSPAR